MYHSFHFFRSFNIHEKFNIGTTFKRRTAKWTIKTITKSVYWLSSRCLIYDEIFLHVTRKNKSAIKLQVCSIIEMEYLRRFCVQTQVNLQVSNYKNVVTVWHTKSLFYSF